MQLIFCALKSHIYFSSFKLAKLFRTTYHDWVSSFCWEIKIISVSKVPQQLGKNVKKDLSTLPLPPEVFQF